MSGQLTSEMINRSSLAGDHCAIAFARAHFSTVEKPDRRVSGAPCRSTYNRSGNRDEAEYMA